MNNENKKNDALSFEDLKKQLGMELSQKEERISENTEVKDDKRDVIVKTTEEKKEPITVTENGQTFLDITSQFVTEEDEQPEKGEKKKTKQKVVQKKRVRTFNEIFSDFFKGFVPLKKDSAREKMRKVVMDISIIAIVACLVAFAKYFVEYRQQISLQNDLRGQIINSDNMSDDQYQQAWNDLYAQFPQIQFPAGMKPDYAYLYATNNDFVGWLRIANTNLDVQVVQSKDNDYYLYRDFYKKSSRYGTPYMDYRNNSKELDDNTVIYGHHMNDGLMFGNLDKYKTLEGYKDSPIIQYSTLYADYQFKVFAVMITTANTADNGGFNYMASNFSSDEKFMNYVNELKLRSIINTDVNVNADDKLITLITCSHDFDDARLVVVGRMVREGEDASVNVSNSALNPEPKYPQAWYDKKGKENPFANV